LYYRIVDGQILLEADPLRDVDDSSALFTDMRNKNIDGKPVRLSKKQNTMNLPRCSLQNSKIQSSVYQVPLNVPQAGDASNVTSGQEER
jgi:hypothetical protein